MYLLYCYIRFFMCYVVLFFFKQKAAYELRISDWSSDVCSSDLSLSWKEVPLDITVSPLQPPLDAEEEWVSLAEMCKMQPMKSASEYNCITYTFMKCV